MNDYIKKLDLKILDDSLKFLEQLRQQSSTILRCKIYKSSITNYATNRALLYDVPDLIPLSNEVRSVECTIKEG